MHERARQAGDPLTFDLSAEGCATAAQDDKVCVERHVQHVSNCEKAALLTPLLIDERQDDPRQLRMEAVQETVSGEVHDAIVAEISAQCRFAAGLEIESGLPLVGTHELEQRIRLSSREWKAWQ